MIGRSCISWVMYFDEGCYKAPQMHEGPYTVGAEIPSTLFSASFRQIELPALSCHRGISLSNSVFTNSKGFLSYRWKIMPFFHEVGNLCRINRFCPRVKSDLTGAGWLNKLATFNFPICATGISIPAPQDSVRLSKSPQHNVYHLINSSAIFTVVEDICHCCHNYHHHLHNHGPETY